jgi:monofunctional biosynthetic peptidoglycan transglycosylase
MQTEHNSLTAPLEITILTDRIMAAFRAHKLRTIFLYLLFLLYFSLPGLQIPLFEYQTKRISSVMEQRAIEHFMVFYPAQSRVSLDEVSPVLYKSILCMEDDGFFTHHGVCWSELQKSMQLNAKKKKAARGGSTVTMQLAKNLFFTTNKSVIRKAKELIVTFRMEKEISKSAILRNYVNVIEWGDGIFGIREASTTYFKKEPAKLSLAEASRLAAVIPSPLVHDPTVNSRYVARRSSIIRSRYNNIVLPL